MRVNSWVFLVILISAVVTWIPRILPFVLVKYRGLPDALILSSLVDGKVGQLPQVRWLDLLAAIPTMLVAFRYKNLMGTVLFGIILVALLRLLVA